MTLRTASALALLGSTLLAQGNLVPMPPHAAVYNGYSRGYNFTANTSFFIQSFNLPLDAFQAGDTAGVFCRVNGATAFYSVGNAASQITVTPPIQINPGDVVDVIGNWSPATTGNFTAHNSYSATFALPGYNVPIEGVAHNLARTGWQWDIGAQNTTVTPPAPAGGTYLAPVGGQLGRIEMYTTPPAGTFAGFSATPTSGALPLQVQFTDTSFTSDPGGIALYEWDVDNDGTFDYFVQNPQHTYTVCGTYDVRLRITDASGVQSDLTKPGFITAGATPTASFTVSLLAPPNVWQFTDTTTPAATAWAWDFDGDGSVDDIAQNPVYVSTGSFLSLPNCTLTATLDCQSDTVVQPVFNAGSATQFLGATLGGNGTSSASAVGNYFDVQVTSTEGLNIGALTVAPYSFTGLFEVLVYVTEDTHVGKTGNATLWTLAGRGFAVSSGGAFNPPTLVDVGLERPFHLEPGNYGMVVYLTKANVGGGTVNVAYTNGPAAAPYVGADMTIHPAGVGCATTSLLGNCTFSPRLWNGGFYYTKCSQTSEAATGFYGIGCVNTTGQISGLEATTLPRLGTSFDLTVTNMPAPEIALMMAGDNKDLFGALPLPLDLGLVGAPGCPLQQNALVLWPVIGAAGQGSFSWAVPVNPTLACVPLYFQAAVLDTTANSLGFVTSNAQAAVLGN